MKNLAYDRHWISWRVQIIALMQNGWKHWKMVGKSPSSPSSLSSRNSSSSPSSPNSPSSPRSQSSSKSQSSPKFLKFRKVSKFPISLKFHIFPKFTEFPKFSKFHKFPKIPRGRQGVRKDWPMRGLTTDHVITGPLKSLKKNCMENGHTDTRTLRLLDWIDLVAEFHCMNKPNALKVIWNFPPSPFLPNFGVTL